jgi:predicted ester cyclase
MTALEHWFEEVWNKQNASAIDELWVPEKRVHGLAAEYGKQVKSKEEFKMFHKLFCTAFPDMHIKVETVIREGDMVATRVLVTGTHTGPGFPAVPKGNRISFHGMCMAHVKDGKIIESWNNFDFMSMYKQMEE